MGRQFLKRSQKSRIVNFLKKNGNLFCLGRTGISRYNNADGSIEMGPELAQRLL